jgi:hypothetical protein
MFLVDDYSVSRGILDYTVRFPDGNTLRIAPVQHLLVVRAGEHIPLPAYAATNEEIIDAAIQIRNDLVDLSPG